MTNLELTTGERDQGQESSQFEITFKGGIKEVVSAARKNRIVELWENHLVTGIDKALRFPSGKITRVSGITDIKPVIKRESDELARANMARINKILAAAPIKSERKKCWLEKINANIVRSQNGGPWVYYDKLGQEVSRDQADMIFRKPDAVVVEKGVVVQEVYRRPHIV
jgi:hypothetical protein